MISSTLPLVPFNPKAVALARLILTLRNDLAGGSNLRVQQSDHVHKLVDRGAD